MKRLGLVCTVLFLALTLLGCRGTQFVAPPTTAQPVLLEKPMSETEVRTAIIRGLELRKFKAEGEEQGRIVARYQSGQEEVQVAVEYNGVQFAVRYLQSGGFKQIQAPDGSPLIDDKILKMTDRLSKSIRESLGRPAKEAAEAAQKKRDHELDMERQRTAAAQAGARTAEANANAQAAAAAAAAAPPPEAAPAPLPPPPPFPRRRGARQAEPEAPPPAAAPAAPAAPALAALGKTCKKDDDCDSKLCVFRGSAQYGYCTKECESWSNCPSFWECKKVGNATMTYCVQPAK